MPSSLCLNGLVNAQVEELAGDKVRLTVDVPAHDVHHAVEHALDDLAESAKIPGFRKGKVPRPVLLQRLGKERVMAEAVDSHIGGWFWNAAASSRIRPVENPRYEYELPTDDHADWSFAATVTVQPKPEVPDWTQLEVGYAEPEVVGQSVDIIFTEEDRAAGAPEQEMNTALAHGRASDERVHRRKDGSRFWASGALMLMRDGAGRPVGFAKILRDQTAARDAQVALERSQADLLQVLAEKEAARAELETADAAKDRFLAVLSHELRNPLASIDSAAALLQTPVLPARDRDAAASVVKRQASAMKSLLDELLDISRLKLGRLDLHREDVLLATVVTSALETTRGMLDTSGHRLELDQHQQFPHPAAAGCEQCPGADQVPVPQRA